MAPRWTSPLHSHRLVDGSARVGAYEPKYCDPHRLRRSQLLQLFHKTFSLCFVIPSGPVVVQVVQNFHPPVELIEKPAKHAGATECFDGIQESAGQDIFKPNQSWIGDWDSQ